MPKIPPTDIKKKQLMARSIIKGKAELLELRSADIAIKTHNALRTYQQKIQYPEKLRLGDLWVMCSILKLSDDEIVKLIRGKETQT